MNPVDQHQALASSGPDVRLGGEQELGAGDRARYWRSTRYDDLECLAARFFSHRYALHTHDSYVVGTIVGGCETYLLNGERRYAGVGDLCFVQPGEVHDGEPHGEGYAYRMTYPTVALMRQVASEVTGRPVTATPSFRAPVVHDPEAAARFAAAHRSLAEGDRLAGDERFVSVLAVILSRHADIGEAIVPGRENRAVGRVRDYLDAHFAEDVELAELAAVAGLSRFHLIRAFRRETGLTPHAWLTDRRVRAARPLLAAGLAPGEVALACGFADQSHLTRAFKARVGVTPGRFRAAGREPGGRRAA
ncbi:transcriptional regulator, AraC family [Tistlia consotensis]|uniref:Transcriptional regulator, AraC family n=1 Tax=Tistlia consotensis USBA 355 TaxID=560819 RepID=A0A1Y6B864_9PROT|nr:AraC family transcriptional regulator [Tistlia consotensis]SME90373.1 transcriptional regulator, AraC family [Tistlia consotensis USBA 355]SNR26684.1 transcriptional regulator, AraC family [Tistlia consotensis]